MSVPARESVRLSAVAAEMISPDLSEASRRTSWPTRNAALLAKVMAFMAAPQLRGQILQRRPGQDRKLFFQIRRSIPAPARPAMAGRIASRGFPFRSWLLLGGKPAHDQRANCGRHRRDLPLRSAPI